MELKSGIKAFQAGKETCQFRVMPFRIRIAPQIFTRLLSALLTKVVRRVSDIADSKEERVKLSLSHRCFFLKVVFMLHVGESWIVSGQKFTSSGQLGLLNKFVSSSNRKGSRLFTVQYPSSCF